MTSEQASILYGVVKERRAPIVEKWSAGICDGLLYTLMHIDRGGGAVLQDHVPVLDYNGGIIEAAVIPPTSCIAWSGIRPVTRPFWVPAPAVLPDGPLSFYRVLIPVVIVPMAAAVLPDPPLAPLPLR